MVNYLIVLFKKLFIMKKKHVIQFVFCVKELNIVMIVVLFIVILNQKIF